MIFKEMSDNQRRVYIDTAQLYEAFMAVYHKSRAYRGGMHWKKAKGREYLFRSRDRYGYGKSLGLRSPETEKILKEFRKNKQQLKERLESLKNRMKEQARFCKAAMIQRVPRVAAEILRLLDQQKLLSRNVLIVGTNALYAYEAAAGAFVDTSITATEDLDILWDVRSRLTLVPAQSRHLLPKTIDSQKVRTVSAQLAIAPEKLLGSLSYSHFELIVALDDDLKRTFYEIECIRGNWSVRELKRQINSLYYERSGLSKDKKKLVALAHESAEIAEPKLAIRDPYIFEFLGLKPREVMSESHLEDQLLDKLQEFLLELGHGFCFEARRKRILIGDTHNFVDLVFYHRILKCHVLVELKLEQFSHENIGQLNTYVSWYKKNMMPKGDNSPIGILLCTQRDSTLVEYALAGMDNGLFVSKYQLELPKKEDMQRFIEEQVRETGS